MNLGQGGNALRVFFVRLKDILLQFIRFFVLFQQLREIPLDLQRIDAVREKILRLFRYSRLFAFRCMIVQILFHQSHISCLETCQFIAFLLEGDGIPQGNLKQIIQAGLYVSCVNLIPFMNAEIRGASDLMEELAPFRIQDSLVIEFIDLAEEFLLLRPHVVDHVLKGHSHLEQSSMQVICPLGLFTECSERREVALQELESEVFHICSRPIAYIVSSCTLKILIFLHRFSCLDKNFF